MLKENQETTKTRLHDGGKVLISDQDTTFRSKENSSRQQTGEREASKAGEDMVREEGTCDWILLRNRPCVLDLSAIPDTELPAPATPSTLLATSECSGEKEQTASSSNHVIRY